MADPPAASDLDLVQSAPRRFVLVTGAGRSGTSTMSGGLNYLGLHSPQPSLGANASNPRGFFEPKWAIDFHRRILERATVDTFDARPDAFDRVQAEITAKHEGEIVAWLTEELRRAPQIVVKDPRSTWMPLLWESAASRLDTPTSFVAMLRHPAEVVGSRATYYAKGDSLEVRRYQVLSVARWVNASLITERQTRGKTRAFVRYEDLLDDWRPVMRGIQQDFDLHLNTGIEMGARHEVDEFIDPALRRHQVTWADLDVPEALRDIADDTWRLCSRIGERRGSDAEAENGLDELSERYRSLFDDAVAIAHDVAAAEAKLARRKAVRKVRAAMQSEANDPSPAQGRAGLATRLLAGWTRAGR
ncbi:MAG: sulfotransferase family protein [Nocardioidaceae bacterium]|nr:sulfotransferase family protein [Nocardioidaceae bacterium]